MFNERINCAAATHASDEYVHITAQYLQVHRVLTDATTHRLQLLTFAVSWTFSLSPKGESDSL